MNSVYKLILILFTIGLLSCGRRITTMPSDVPKDPIGYCYEYAKSTTQCYMPDKVCYLYSNVNGNHLICSKR